jgi:putative membrane protein
MIVDFIKLLFSTVVFRPYVFVFLACYLFLAITHIGWKRTALFSVVAYLVAFICEWSSAVAGTGFPFGLYHYINTTGDRELWVAGVPFMDSLSFVFLSYVSWELSTLLLGRVEAGLGDVRVLDADSVRGTWKSALLASFLMTYLDIIIDPVALQGDRWFLGKIYYYPEGGSYFGITIANFLGWFFVCLAIIRIFVRLERSIFKSGDRAPSGVTDYRFKALGSVGLYFGVLGFNLFMTFWIGEIELGIVGIFIILPLILSILLALDKASSPEM